jgi:hypothetical protein
MSKYYKIIIDFDNTVVRNQYPEIGDELPMATYWVRQWIIAGAQIILLTMRDGEKLDAAVQWFWARGIKISGINAGIGDSVWTTSPKPFAHCIVDDTAFGCPLDNKGGVDWGIVGPKVLEQIKEYYGE